MGGVSDASGSNRSLYGIADVEKILKKLKNIIGKQVDAESNYVRKTRSLIKRLSGSDNKKLVKIDVIENLLQQLKDKISLLVDAQLKNATNQQQAKLRKSLIDLSYEIDYCIDAITWAGENVSRGKGGSFRVSTLSYGGANLKNFKEEIELVFSRLQQCDVTNNYSWDKVKRLIQHSSSSSVVVVDQDNFFGPEKEKIKQLLLTQSQAPVIALWGPGGLGKTTLVKKLYIDLDIRRCFQSFAWISMPPEDFQPRYIMQSILEQLLPGEKKLIMEMSFVELTERLYRVQKDNKCLIVLCDVRKLENWRRLSMVFPPADTTRTQILLTTREEDVAKKTDISYRVSPLDEKQSWELFKKREISDNQHPEKMVMEIVNRCKGSRLAIAILTGYVINATDKSSSDWEIVLADELQSHLSDQETDVEKIVQNIVSLSYSKLPHELQECFLYLGHFPVDQEIQADEFYNRWIDEGLISQTDTEEKMMEVAQNYLEELVLRNLVQMLEEEKSCKVHPLVRDFCIIEAEKEKLYKVISTDPQVGIQYSRSIASRLHSLSFFHTWEPPAEVESTSKREIFDLAELEWLRFLEFYGVDFRKWNLPNVIGELIYLKYLSFKRCYLENLPSSIGDLSHLKTLDLRVQAFCRISIPNVLWKMSKLKRLYFPLRYECADSHGRLSLGSLEELEILVNFNTEVCDARDLEVMKKLQKLDAVVEENYKDLEKIVDFTNVVFTNLRDLSLYLRNFNCYSAEKRAVLGKLLDWTTLGSLRLEGYLRQFPEHHMSISPKLTQIVLSGAELEADPMPIFGEIPNLRSLTLCNDAYIGKEMNCNRKGFPELKTLKIMNLRSLETWTVENGAMPKLLCLSIEKCVKLVMLPAGLNSLALLRELNIASMPAAFEARLRQVQGKGEDVSKGQSGS